MSSPSVVRESTSEPATGDASGVREISADRYVRPRWYVTAAALALVLGVICAGVAAAAGSYELFWHALTIASCAGLVLAAHDGLWCKS